MFEKNLDIGFYTLFYLQEVIVKLLGCLKCLKDTEWLR